MLKGIAICLFALVIFAIGLATAQDDLQGAETAQFGFGHGGFGRGFGGGYGRGFGGYGGYGGHGGFGGYGGYGRFGHGFGGRGHGFYG